MAAVTVACIQYVVLMYMYYRIVYTVKMSMPKSVCNIIMGCHRQPLNYFHFDFRYVMLDIYIYIIYASTHNHNNEFILEFILRETKMADFERRQLEIQLEFVC